MANWAWRDTLARFVDSQWFQNLVVAVILANGVVLGLETYEDRFVWLDRNWMLIEGCFLTFFVLELTLRILARGVVFFRDVWNWFDLVVVGISLIPLAGGFAVLRLVRVLRLLRLVSVLPSLRYIVDALFRSVPGLGTVIALLFVVMYTAAIMGEQLFGEISPQYFGNLGTTLYTLFMLLTMENWPDISDSVIEDAPYAWIFFVSYIVVSAFIVLNLIIGVIVTTMEEEVSAPAGQRTRRSNCTSTNRSCSAWSSSATRSRCCPPSYGPSASPWRKSPTSVCSHWRAHGMKNGPPPNEGEGPEEKTGDVGGALRARARQQPGGPWGLERSRTRLPGFLPGSGSRYPRSPSSARTRPGRRRPRR